MNMKVENRMPTDHSVAPASSSRFRYPCTGRVAHQGFGNYLETHLGEPRVNLREFASSLSSRFSAPHVTLVNSGSSANLAASLALMELTGPGTAITAGFTFPTTLNSLLTAGYTVKICDTTRNGFGLSPQAVRNAMSDDVKVVCLTHFLGFPGELVEIRSICDEYGVLLLQDACESMDLRLENSDRSALSFGDVITWSFYHPHHLSSYGGGAVVTCSSQMHSVVESIVHWGRACRCHDRPDLCEAPAGMDHQFWYVRPGHNLEMSELNACFGRFQLERWDRDEAARKRNYECLWNALRSLTDSCIVYASPKNSGSAFVFPITLLNKRSVDVQTQLTRAGVECRSLMGGSINRHPAYASIPHDGLTNCEHLGANSFFVGIHQTLPEPDVTAVAGILYEVLSCR